MSVRALFGLSALMSLVASSVLAKLYVWPRLRIVDRGDALVPLVAPHMFLRFIGLSFLVRGVVSPSLPAAFAVPAAYGDFVSGLLAIVAVLALSRRVRWAIPLVWIFNVWVRLTSSAQASKGRLTIWIPVRWERRSLFQRRAGRTCL